MQVDVVIPTIGRSSLAALLRALEDDPLPGRVIVVDDRPHPNGSVLPPWTDGGIGDRLEVVRSGGRGPAAARNRGWRRSAAEWVAFLDDDVVPESGWFARLLEDLRHLPDGVAASQGRVEVPVHHGRPLSDWERNVKSLEEARWITADLTCRRDALVDVGGFEEGFRRAYREDTDLALRLLDRGWQLVEGDRRVEHPVGPASSWVSVRLQAGNADDVLLTARHGRTWRERIGEGRGRRPRHLAIVAAALAVITGLVLGWPVLAWAGVAGWLVGTAELAWARLSGGPWTLREVLTMLATSVAIPPAAAFYWVRGLVRAVSEGWGRERGGVPARPWSPAGDRSEAA